MKIRAILLDKYFIQLLLVILFFSSCTPVKNAVYFQNIQKDTTVRSAVNNNFELKIRKNDLLFINIVSSDALQTPLFNAQQPAITASGVPGVSSSPSSGFLVDGNGNILIYKLGVVHVEGLTRNELKQKLEKAIVPDYLKDAVITVRFLSNKVTILGEVTHPQVITLPNEQISLLEALGMSGDITITGRKDNVLVVRETPSGKQFKRLNLTDNSIFSSPFYYLRPDDVVYVEPTKTKINNAGNTPQVIGYALSALAILITILLNIIHK